MTIGAQSVRAMMPKRTSGVSGPSAAKAPPTQPRGTPNRSIAAVDVPAALMKLRLVVCVFISTSLLLVRQEHIGRHHEGASVGLARGRLLEEGAGDERRVPRREAQIGRQGMRDLHIDLLSDAAARGA